MIFIQLVFTLLVSIALLTSNTAWSRSFHFVSIEQLAEQEIGRIVLPKIYQKLGLNITISPLPGKRAQAEAISGRKDGEIMRIWYYGIENPSTIRVPTPYYYLETMAFIRKDSDITIKTKEDLAHHRLLKIRGVKHTNRITEGLSNVIDVDSTEKMFKLLEGGRADVALTNTLDGQIILNKYKFESIVAIEKPLAILPLYHYLHRSHEQWVGKVDEVLQSMTKSGELKTLTDDAKQQVVSRSNR